jgi:predicted MFS family arabinose efflux permease
MIITGRLGSTYAPLRLPAYRAFFAAQTVSTIGSLVQSTAQAWVAYGITRSPAALGTIATLSVIPMAVVGRAAGSVADQFDRRRVLISTQVALAILAAALAVLVQNDAVQAWHLYVLAVLSGAVTALDAPALQAYASDLVGAEHVRQAVTLGMMGFQVSRTLGPPLAGVLVVSIGSASAFWVNAVSFLVVAAAISAVRGAGNDAGQRRTNSTPRTTTPGTLAQAVRHVRDNPFLINLYVLPLLYVLGMASSTLYPAYVRDALHADADALGTIIGAWGAGTFATSLVILPLVNRARLVGLTCAAALAWFGAVLLGLGVLGIDSVRETVAGGLRPNAVSVAATLAFLSGVTGPVVLSQSTGLIQAMAPSAMRGRLSGLSGTLNSGLQPITNLAVGYSGEAIGVPATMIGNGAILIGAVVALVALRPSVRAPLVADAPSPSGSSPTHEGTR